MMSTWKEMRRRVSIKKKLKKMKLANRARLTELAIHGVEAMEEEPGPSKKCLQKSQGPPKKSLHKSRGMIERCERLNTCVAKADSDADDF
jgi:hypothetical protein